MIGKELIHLFTPRDFSISKITFLRYCKPETPDNKAGFVTSSMGTLHIWE